MVKLYKNQNGFTLTRILANAKNPDNVQAQRAFTLIELLVVMAILGILATVGIGNFMTAQMKSRDARRKSDLEQIQKGLEMYMADHGTYPPSATGRINTGTSLDWTSNPTFSDTKGTVYMQALPSDPSGKYQYCYVSTGTTYQLYAMLENGRDPGINGTHSCGGESAYNYGVSSSNSAP